MWLVNIVCHQVPVLIASAPKARQSRVSPATGCGSFSLILRHLLSFCVLVCCVSSVAVSTPPPAASRFQRHRVAAVHSMWSTRHYFPSHVLFYFRASSPFIFIHLGVCDLVDTQRGAAGGMHAAALPQQRLFCDLVTSPGCEEKCIILYSAHGNCFIY